MKKKIFVSILIIVLILICGLLSACDDKGQTGWDPVFGHGGAYLVKLKYTAIHDGDEGDVIVNRYDVVYPSDNDTMRMTVVEGMTYEISYYRIAYENNGTSEGWNLIGTDFLIQSTGVYITDYNGSNKQDVPSVEGSNGTAFRVSKRGKYVFKWEIAPIDSRDDVTITVYLYLDIVDPDRNYYPD